MADDTTAEQRWQALLTGENLDVPVKGLRHAFRLVPSEHRCMFCNSPFDLFSALVFKMIGRGTSRIFSKFCNICQVESSKFIGGTEIDLTLLFADVRGSTSLAEGMNPSEFSKIISRFFGVSSKILLKSGVWLVRVVGDQIIGMCILYYVGGNHQLAAIEAAKALLRATGHDSADGPWIPLGVDVHCGNAFVETVGSHDAATDITVLDDTPNAAAKLLSAAAAGEIMLSDGAYDIAGLTDDLERRTLELKVKSEQMGVCVLTDISK